MIGFNLRLVVAWLFLLDLAKVIKLEANAMWYHHRVSKLKRNRNKRLLNGKENRENRFKAIRSRLTFAAILLSKDK